MGKIIDITGQKFGLLTVIENVGKIDGRNYYWKCKCDCGEYTTVLGTSLRNGNTKSCGCLRNKGLILYNQKMSEEAKIPIGARFGKLTVIEDLGLRKQTESHNRRWYKCKCDCGNECEVMGNMLKQGQKHSCGCINSYGEYIIIKILQENNILFNHNVVCKELLQDYQRPLRFDFEILNNDGTINRYIEFDGRQHTYGPDTEYWSRSEDTLETILERDNIKNAFCKKHNYKLIRIPYYHKNITLEDIMSDKFEVGKEELS